MRRIAQALLAAVVAVGLLAPVAALAQEQGGSGAGAEEWTTPRTPFGHPDL